MDRPAVVASLLLASCAGSAPIAPVLQPGTTAVLVGNDVRDPYRLERVIVAIDGERASLMAVPPSGRGTAIAGRFRLAPGDHTLEVMAAASCTTSNAEPRVATLNTAQGFRVSEAAAALTVELYLAGGCESAADAPALDAAFRLQGGELDPAVGVIGAYDPERRCQKMPPIKRAICRAEVEVERARSEHDVVRLACAAPKLAEMRVLAAGVADARAAGEAFGAPVVADAAERSIVSLGSAVANCLGREILRVE